MVRIRLDAVLRKRRLSKRQFAIRLGMDYASVFRFFRANYDPKLSMLERWARAIGCRIADLFQDIKRDTKE